MMMVKDLLLRDKKGVSLMMGYVLLIIIAIGLSIAVYSFLVLYLPSQEPGCPDDIKMTVDKVVCDCSESNYVIILDLTNRGLFDIDGVIVKAGKIGRFGNVLNRNEEDATSPKAGESINNAMFTLLDKAGDPVTSQPNDYQVEIEPYVFIEEESDKPQLCSHNLVTQPIVDCPPPC